MRVSITKSIAVFLTVLLLFPVTLTAEEPGSRRAKQISTGTWHSLVLMEDGSAWGFGSNLDGALNNSPEVNLTPVMLANEISFAKGFDFDSFFIDNDGVLYRSGYDIVYPLRLDG